MNVTTSSWREHGRAFASFRHSPAFLRSATNAQYSVAEYLALPLLLLAATPLLVARLGFDQYGIWMLATALTGSVGVLSIGLGDATVKYVAAYRGQDDLVGVNRVIGAAVAINALLGAVFAGAVWISAPFLVRHVFKIMPNHFGVAIHAIQFGGGVLFFRSIDSVFVSILRAFEQYGPSVRFAVLTKVLMIAFSIGATLVGYGVVVIMALTMGTAALGACLQGIAIRQSLPGVMLWPSLDTDTWREIASFGFYTWILSVASMMFSQADRLLIGAQLGTEAVAYYTICVQVAQPIHGLMGAAFNFLFPHLSARHGAGDTHGSKRVFVVAAMVNIACTLALSISLIVFGKIILAHWIGRTFAEQAYPMLIVLVIAFAFLSINVVPHYALLALGKVRFVSLLNVAGGGLSLVAAGLMIPTLGPIGAAVGRLCYGPMVTLNYVKVAKNL